MRSKFLLLLPILFFVVSIRAVAQTDEANVRARITELCAPDEELFQFPVPIEIEQEGVIVRLYAERTLDGDWQRLRLLRVRGGEEQECVGVAVIIDGKRMTVILRQYRVIFQAASRLFRKKLMESEGKKHRCVTEYVNVLRS